MVLSSTWRLTKAGRQRARAALAEYDLEVFGVTPVVKARTLAPLAERPSEILQWMQEHNRAVEDTEQCRPI